jgi:hypothetical protein|tara:strand:+ start:12684 stop:13319 length:636 start_codon:yes stop_codon:yes gene_type:complete
MADVGGILDTPNTGGATYYDETQDKPKVAMPEGVYPAHVIKVDSAVRDVRGSFKAVIYNVRVKIAPEADDITFDAVDYDGNEVKVNGGDFTGREIRSNGVFKFMHPSESDEFESNPGGNKGYSNFCTVLGKQPKTTILEVDGEKVTMKELPDLSEDDILGKPVLAVVGKGKPWTSERDGKTRTSLEVKWFRTWADGKDIDPESFEDDDLPF